MGSTEKMVKTDSVFHDCNKQTIQNKKCVVCGANVITKTEFRELKRAEQAAQKEWDKFEKIVLTEFQKAPKLLP